MDVPRRLVLAGGLAVALKPENPILGGTILRRAAIQSPNFVKGSAGWQINQDGSAEFNNVVIRNGQVVSGTALYYSSTPPALGKLVASVSAAAGTDTFGNAYLAGITSYSPNAVGINFAVGMQANAQTFYTAPAASNGAGPWTSKWFAALDVNGNQMQISGQAGVTAGTAIIAGRLIVGPVLECQSQLELDAIAAPGTPAGAAFVYADLSGNPHFVLPSSFTGAIPGTQTDTTDRTVTQAASNPLGASFTIPANDAVAGTVYRYRCGGTGQWGSTQQQLTLIQALAGANVNQDNVAATSFAISDPFDWDLWLEVAVKTTGAGGTCNCRMMLAMSKNNAASGTNLTQVRRAAAVAFNTTISNTLQLRALWASTTGAPTITGNYSTFERIGP